MPTDLSLSFFESALAQFNELVDRLSSADSQNWEHGKLERYIHESGTELLRLLDVKGGRRDATVGLAS
ncbi:hypothetical protein Lepto7375DRAFT_1099 [Leptolyngbya sp. PCC 7375]|nr:hypothetical protein Lepto7375DRAFT_1099 [Leptolyngbya sp. PCC 7375]